MAFSCFVLFGDGGAAASKIQSADTETSVPMFNKINLHKFVKLKSGLYITLLLFKYE